MSAGPGSTGPESDDPAAAGWEVVRARLARHALVEQAVGVLMEQDGCGARKALRRLVDDATDLDVTVPEAARRVIARLDDRPVRWS